MGPSDIERVVSRFRHLDDQSGNELYLPQAVAEDFLAACVHGNLAVLGIEGFRREGTEIRARMDLIADFSSLFHGDAKWQHVLEQSQRLAREFLSECGARECDLWFAFVLAADLQEPE